MNPPMTLAAVITVSIMLVVLGRRAGRWLNRPILHRPLDEGSLQRLLQAVLLRYAEGEDLLVMVSEGDPRRLRFRGGVDRDGEPAVEMHYPLEEWSRGHHLRVIDLGRRMGVECDWLHAGRTSARTSLVFRLGQDLELGQRLATLVIREMWELDPERDCTGVFVPQVAASGEEILPARPSLAGHA